MCIGGGLPADVFGPPVELASPSVQVEQFFSGMFSDGAGGLVAEGIGAALQAFGAYRNEEARSRSYQYSADVARRNAELERWRERETKRKGEQELFALGIKKGKLAATQRASLAARGLDIGEGSPLDLLTSTEYMYEVDKATAKTNTENEAWAHRLRASDYDTEAEFYDEAADESSPLAAAGGTLLSGATRVASSWYRLRSVN